MARKGVEKMRTEEEIRVEYIECKKAYDYHKETMETRKTNKHYTTDALYNHHKALMNIWFDKMDTLEWVLND